MTAEEFRAQALAYPGATEDFTLRSPVIKVNGKVLARLIEDRDVMLTGFTTDEVDMMLEGDPRAFHATPHFRDDGSLLARLPALTSVALKGYLDRRFRQIASKAAVTAWEAAAAG